MCRFVDNFIELSVQDDEDSSADELPPQMLKDSPEIVILAHNGTEFDFPLWNLPQLVV